MGEWWLIQREMVHVNLQQIRLEHDKPAIDICELDSEKCVVSKKGIELNLAQYTELIRHKNDIDARLDEL